METVKPRFEFRSFAGSFGLVVEKMRKLSPCAGIRESDEIYIMSAANDENNTKIRDGKMDIKVFVREQQGLEQWNPRMKGTFPLATQVVRSEVFPAFGVEPPSLEREAYTLEQYIDELIRPHKDLVPAHVFKRRFAFTVNDCITEYGEILINGAAIMTVAVESTKIDDIVGAKELLGLNEYENVNYLRAIKRVLGMLPMPE